MNSELPSPKLSAAPADSAADGPAPSPYLESRLRLLEFAIARLEQQLADEFATEDTAPMLQELEALVEQRRMLVRRLEGHG